MDKVRAYLKVAYQQRFWILSVVCVIIAAVCWNMAAGALDAEFAANKQKIESEFKAMRDIVDKTVHGNAEVNERYRGEAVKIRAEVLELWKTMYERQRDRVLKWPNVLGDEFLREVSPLTFRQPISNPNIQQIYREFAKERFPRLVEIVQAKKMSENELGMGGGGFDGGGGRGFDAGVGAMAVDAQGNPIPLEKYLVQWLDQGVVRQKLTFANRPTSDEIWVTQEDIWVYETMLRVIANANEANDATRPDNAAIRVIEALEVGQQAATAAKVRGLVMLPAGTGATAEGDPSMLSRDGMTPDTAVDLMANRYIGQDGAVITDGAAVTTGEYRMLPVRMVLMMQQKAIPDVLIECANAALPIEVKRIRINAEKSGAGFDMTLATPGVPGGGTDGGRGFDGGGGGGGFGGGRGFDGGRGGGGTMMSPTMIPGASSVGMATVEFHGIVYIYNPPDPAVLSVPGADAATDPTTVAAAGAAPAL